MFRDDKQRAKVCQRLVEIAGRIEVMWDEREGPTSMAIFAKNGGLGVSKGEQLMIQAAWDFWNGSGHMKLAEAFHTLDSFNLTALGELLTAASRQSFAVDEWLEKYGPGGHCRTMPAVNPAPKAKA